MSPPANPAASEQLIAARRAQILDAATTVFAARGFARATIREIARVAGVADGTIYIYFPNKPALLLGILDRLNQTTERADHFAAADGMDLEDFVRGYVKQRFAMLTESGFDVSKVLIAEILVNQELREMYAQQVLAPTFAVVEAWVEQRATHGGPSPREPRLMLRAVGGMVLGVLMLRLIGDPYLETRWDDVPDLIADVILLALTPSKGV